MDKVQKPSSESTAQVPPLEDHDSIFIEIPKPKAKKTVQEPNSPEPNSYQPKLPYPKRMKVREKDTPSAQQSRFMKLFKQLRLEIGLKDALIEMPKFNKWLSTLLRNKEKLEEIAITIRKLNVMQLHLEQVPEKLKDPGKFLIPCALQELDRTNALADSGASINLLPHSIYKQLGLGALKPTRMTLELANRSVTHPMGIAEDVVVRVDDEPFSGSTTNHSDALPPSSSPVKTSEILEEFTDELTLLKKGVHEENFQVYSNPLFEFDDNFTSSNENPLFNETNEDIENKNSNVLDSDEPVLLNTPLSDKVECSDPEDDIDEIDAFLAWSFLPIFEKIFRNQKETKFFLRICLVDDTPIISAPKSDPLHHEFAGELLTLPSRIAREHEEYLSFMTVLCVFQLSRSRRNVHANPCSNLSSLFPYLSIPVVDSDPFKKEIVIILIQMI
ncbi:reverse transcriptase domain-containing protein [Tanacetum coccineum]